MSAGLEQVPASPSDLHASAPSSADFYFNQAFEEAYHQGPSDIILDSDAAYGEAEHISALFELRDHMTSLLARYRERYARNGAAADYSSYYRDELVDIESQDLSYDQQSTLILGKVYLGTLESLGQLGKFIETNKWTGRKSEDAEKAKVAYLAARKKFQEDVDEYFDHFANEPSESLYVTLQDTVNLARLTLNGYDFVNAETDDYTHVFLGSVLSERAVRMSLKDYVHSEARYGTEDEDKSPTKADVVFPIPRGDMYVQVKMKWQKKTDLKVQPKKQPPHVVVPMQYMRSNLTTEEHAKVTEIILAAAEKKALELKWQEAYAMSGLKKHIALWRIPATQFKDWWAETKEVINAEKQALLTTGQTGANAVESMV